MVLSLRYFTLGWFVFLAFQEVAVGITCYECTGCGGNSNSWSTTSSGSSNAQCSKYFYQNGAVSYANRRLDTPCSPGSDGIGGTTYCCSTDLCNGGLSLSSSLSLTFALVVTVSLFKTIMAN